MGIGCEPFPCFQLRALDRPDLYDVSFKYSLDLLTTYFARFLRDDGIDVATGDACRWYDTLFMGEILTLPLDDEGHQNEYLFVVGSRHGNSEVFY